MSKRMHLLYVLIAMLFYGSNWCINAQFYSPWEHLPLINDGKVNTNWVHIGYGGWEVENGSLRTKPDSRGLGLLVYKKERFGDCQIKVVFKAMNTNCNSGFFVRIADGILRQIHNPGAAYEYDEKGEPTFASIEKMKASSEHEEGPWFAVHRGYEIQLDSNWGDPDLTEYNGNGSVYSFSKSTGIHTDIRDWITLLVTLSGERISVEMDGQRLSVFDSQADLPPKRSAWYEPKRGRKRPAAGYIGLQTHDPGDIFWFREVSVRPITVK